MLILGTGLALIALIILLVIGLAIIVLIISSLIFFLPAGVIALVVWFLTKDLFLTGVAFIAVVVLTLLVRR